jgi:serine protease inhibitor
MARYDRQRYYEDGDTQAVTMNFKSGGGLIVLLPKNADAKAFLASVDGDYFAAIRSGTSGREGTLRLLRFKLAGDTFSLKDALKSLGIPLFDKNDPHITGLTDGEELYITQAVQKAEIELDETGATASAATVIVVAPESMPNPDPSERFEMICNRPFAFILYGDTRDGGATVLFTGVVGKPAA